MAVAWALFCATAAHAEPVTQLPLRFDGNLALPEEVYRAVLTLGGGSPADQYTADAVRDELQAFLLRAGYVLAHVETRVDGDVIRVHIDEGRVRRVVFRGRGSIKTLRFKLALDLPHNVLNLPHLQAELQRLGKRFDIGDVRFELVPTHAQDEDLGPKLLASNSDINEVLEVLAPLVDVRENGDYDLHVLFGAADRTTAVKIKSTLGSPDGLTGGLEYLGPDLLLRGDLWSVEALASTAYFQTPDGTSRPRWSRLRGGIRWMAPPPLGGVRPTLRLRADLMARQRLDLGITRYHWASFDGGLSLSYELREGMLVGFGGGYEYRRFWNLETTSAVSPNVVATDERRRSFIEATAELSFDADEIRLDRRQDLDVSLRVHPEGRRSFMLLWDYQKVFGFGWNDLWVRSRGALMDGDIAIPEEASVGGLALHGVFANAVYAHKVLGAGLAYRVSVTRDLFKLGIFTDWAGYELLDRTAGLESWRLAGTVGGSFHALIASLWQLDIYYGVGRTSDGARDRALSASLKKAF